ncbi:MAG TPA: SDR family NAD(P)-dependent oxidoreductase [Flavobacteriaceae bacterium]|nr:SDR family NAD(P)-dependent oxidoreductase [Flavobacteriaceae bacterium]
MKVVVVSGASGNLGQAVVQYFLAVSYQVIGLVRSKAKEGSYENYEEMEVDLLDEKATQDCVDAILEKYNKIDVAVLTAGGFKSGAIGKTFREDLEHQYRLNFLTAFHFARPALLHMKKQESGRLFFIGSEPGMDTSKGTNNVAYSLSKSQLFQLANIFNSETKELDVKTYVIVPSTIDTPENRKAMPKADYSKWEKPEEIASIIGRYSKHSTASDNMFVIVSDIIKR